MTTKYCNVLQTKHFSLGFKKEIKFYPFLLLSCLIVSFNDNYRRKKSFIMLHVDGRRRNKKMRKVVMECAQKITKDN